MTRLAAGLADTPGRGSPRSEQGRAPLGVAALAGSSPGGALGVPGWLSSAASLPLWAELIQVLARLPRRSRHCIIATAASAARVREPLSGVRALAPR